MKQRRAPRVSPVAVEAEEAARNNHLRYVNDSSPGIARRARGAGFVYRDQKGRLIHDRATLNRIKALAVPPAWKQVWICPLPDGHLQATGRDARGRKQHRYHSRWREVRDESKYAHMISFALALPRIRRRVRADLRQRDLTKTKVLATVVKLLEVSLIRVGNEEYARDNHSFGLTTMRDRHVNINGSKLRFQFRGKSGKEHSIDVQDARLARIVRDCQDIPGQELFQYVDEGGERHKIESGDVNDYLREAGRGDFTAKDFRTWFGTVLAAMALGELKRFESQAQARKNIVRAVEQVAERLGNTPAICRKSYVHPSIISSYLEQSLLRLLALKSPRASQRSRNRLQPQEAAVLGLLQHGQVKEKNTSLHKQLSQSLRQLHRQKR
jgi:DNA topoisomerase-1